MYMSMYMFTCIYIYTLMYNCDAMNYIQLGFIWGFHTWGDTPIAGWFRMAVLGVAL